MTPAARERSQVRVPMLLVCAAAWMLVVIEGPGRVAHAHDPASLPGASRSLGSLEALPAHHQPASLGLGWMLMLTAMMMPLLIPPVRHVRDRSFARRRPRAIMLFLAGYAAIWMMAGALLLALALALGSIDYPWPIPAALMAGVALVWQCSPIKQRCLNRGRAHPALAAAGPASDIDVVRFGLTHGFWCSGSCWALMMLPVLIPHAHIPAMAMVTLWLVAERMDSPASPSWRLRVPARAARMALAQSRMMFRRRHLHSSSAGVA